MPLKLLATGLMILGLGACAKLNAPVAYGPWSGNVGYIDERIDKDSYRVSFEGDRNTPRQLVEHYALLRAAEVALKAGHSHFAVIDKATEEKRRLEAYATGTHLSPLRTRRSRYHGDEIATQLMLRDPFPPFRYREVTRFVAIAVIRPYSVTPPTGSYQHHDAAAILRDENESQ